MMLNPLQGTKVLDATRLLPGGYCSMMLSEFGADVIKVEEPGLGDYMRLTPPLKGEVSLVHNMVNRNKMSLGLNLKTREGRRILTRLLRRSDVFIEGFRPGAVERLGFSFDAVKKISPKIVYCSISAFGRDSKLSSIPGHDINFQAMSGTLDLSDARVPLVQYADICAGMFAALGILAALCSPRRRATFVDVPIVQSLLSWSTLAASHYFVTGKSPRDEPSLAFGSEAYYNLYKTADERLVAVAAIEREFWRNLVAKLGIGKLETRRRGTQKQRDSLKARMGEIFSSKRRDEWSRILLNSETCASPVLSLEEALESDWAKRSGVVRRDASKKRILGTPLRMRPRPEVVERRAPKLGEHSREILSRLGYSNRAIDSLARDGVISINKTGTLLTRQPTL